MTLRDEAWLPAFDARDPLHAEMLTYLRAVRTKGRYSPVRRILARWASNGYLLELGRIPSGSTPDAAAIFDALAGSGLLNVQATPEAVTEALACLTNVASGTRRPSLDLVEVQREIAAIEAAAAGMDFE